MIGNRHLSVLSAPLCSSNKQKVTERLNEGISLHKPITGRTLTDGTIVGGGVWVEFKINKSKRRGDGL